MDRNASIICIIMGFIGFTSGIIYLILKAEHLLAAILTISIAQLLNFIGMLVVFSMYILQADQKEKHPFYLDFIAMIPMLVVTFTPLIFTFMNYESPDSPEVQ